jgi:LysM repeat protein
MFKKSTKMGLVLFTFLGMTTPVYALDEQPPEVVGKQFSTAVAAYQGNSVPGYINFNIKTNEPTRGYLLVSGNGVQTKVILSTTDFKTEHNVNWAPWDDAKRVPLPPGVYTVKSYLQDEALNQAQGFPLGQITIVAESHPKPLISSLMLSPSTISPKYNRVETPAHIQYQVNRHAEVQLSIQKNGEEVFRSPKQKLDPGLHTFEWNGRNTNGNIVADGEYDIALKTIELDYNSPSTDQTVEKFGKITVKDGEYYLPASVVKEFVTDASFADASFSPNGDGQNDTVGGSFTLAKPAKVTAYIANAAGVHMNSVIYMKDLNVGVHSFTWDGKDMMGSAAPNGTYHVKILVTDSNGDSGYAVPDNAQVSVKDSYDIKIAEPKKEVRVITETTNMKVSPMDQGYFGKKGDVFPLLSLTSENGMYKVLVKEGVAGKVNAADVEFVEATPVPVTPAPSSFITHTVASGEVLWKIAQKYGVTIQAVMDANQLNGNGYLTVGQKLVIPVTAPKPVIPPTSTVHTVQAGDTLWKIAQKYGVTVQAITGVNQLNANMYLVVGQKLTIPKKPTSATVHTVLSGDTLWKVAKKYGVTVQALAETNQILPTAYLTIGQKLTIPTQPTSTLN